ncbi:MAG: SprB repeat-containing protein, partial [Bacteroidota bacterium]
YDAFWASTHTPPDTLYTSRWDLNKNFSNASQLTLRYIAQTYDTLIDVNNNFAGTPRAGTTVTVDSFDLYLLHHNTSGANDTLIISVFDKNTATVTGSGVTSALNTTPLWADTIIANSDFFLTNDDFYVVTSYPNITLPAGHVAGIRVDFAGPVTDTLGVAASFRDKCSSQEFADTNKIAPRNTSFYWNFAANSSFANFTTNLAFNAVTCRYFYIQNLYAFPYLTLNTPSGGSCTVDPNTTQGITPTSDNVPCVNQGQSFSQTYTFVVPATVGGFATVTSMRIDSIGNLPLGLNYSFDQNPPTYAGGAKGCILVTGTTAAACGQYKVLIYVTAVTSVGTFSNELGALATQFAIPGFSSPFLRVKATAGTCPAVNNAQTANFVADPTCGIAVTISLTTSATNVNCFGGNNGTASVTATGGSNYTYSWNTSPVQTTATATGLAAGTYTVTVTSGTATATASVSVTQPSILTATASATQSSCLTPTGSATVAPAGGTPGYTVVWNNTQTTTTISNIGAGNYTVIVTDTKGCTATASTQVTTTSGPSATAATTSVACFGGSTGAV